MVKNIYLKVRPQKLDLSVLAQVFNNLNRLKRIKPGNRGLTNHTDQAWYLQKHWKYVPVKIAEGELGEFISKYELNLSDIKSVKGGNTIDLEALSEASYQELDNTKSFVFPASRIKTELNQTLEQSILSTIGEMEGETDDSRIVDKEEFNDTIDVTEATPIQTTRSRGFSFLGGPNQSDLNLSRSLLDTGELDSAFYGPTTFKPRQDITEPKSSSETGGSTSEVGKVPVMTSGLQLKLDASQSIPSWKRGSNAEENARLTERYISDLKRLKKLNIGKSDAWVINSSLLKSGKTEFYMELPAGADEDLDKYIEYLQTAYGQSKVTKRRCLANIKQEHGESPHSFLSRIINMYYSVRAEEPKSIENIKEDDNETFDILSLYLKGLSNARVRTILKSKIDDLELETLCDQTRNLCDAYGDGEEHVINLVQNTNDMNRKISDLSEKLENISINYVKNRSSNNSNRSGKNCFRRNRF